MSTNPWQASVQQVRGEWGWFLALGIFLVLLGSFGIAEPFFFTGIVIFVSGFLVLFGGGAQVVQAFYARRWSGFLLQLLIGILDIIVGLFMIAQPAEAAELLTLLLAAWFLAGGLFRMVGSLVMRFPNWGWTAFSGFISALLGLAILMKWPYSGEFFIGLCVGISLLFQGWSWIMLALSLRSLPAPAPLP
jgi:uncharacterized membrane protein HdeD (DUF308 family)